jgi:hypothetical protein
MTKLIIDCSTGIETTRELTADEIKQQAEYEAGIAKLDSIKVEAETKAAADKAALLAKLGITADEAKLLLS